MAMRWTVIPLGLARRPYRLTRTSVARADTHGHDASGLVIAHAAVAEDRAPPRCGSSRNDMARASGSHGPTAQVVQGGSRWRIIRGNGGTPGYEDARCLLSLMFLGPFGDMPHTPHSFFSSLSCPSTILLSIHHTSLSDISSPRLHKYCHITHQIVSYILAVRQPSTVPYIPHAAG